MTHTLNSVDSARPDTVTTTREHLLDLIDEIASRWETAPLGGPGLGSDETTYLGLWRKTARRTLKRILPYVGEYRRDVPPFHNLAEYTFPRQEYETLERCLAEIRERAGPRADLYRVPTQLPYIGLGWTQDPLADGKTLTVPRSTYSPIMIHLCLAQKTRFLFEQICHLYNRSPTLSGYLGHPFRGVALELGHALEAEWTAVVETDDSHPGVVIEWQEGILQEIESGLDWNTIEQKLDTGEGMTPGTAAPGWDVAGQVLGQILGENLEFARRNAAEALRRNNQPSLHLPLLADALARWVADGHDISFLHAHEDTAPSLESALITFALGRHQAPLNRRQFAIYTL